MNDNPIHAACNHNGEWIASYRATYDSYDKTWTLDINGKQTRYYSSRQDTWEHIWDHYNNSVVRPLIDRLNNLVQDCPAITSYHYKDKAKHSALGLKILMEKDCYGQCRYSVNGRWTPWAPEHQLLLPWRYGQ